MSKTKLGNESGGREGGSHEASGHGRSLDFIIIEKGRHWKTFEWDSVMVL